MLRDDMKKGGLAFLYYSNCSEIGIVDIMTIVRRLF
jgi:predicted RNA-binding protein with PUA-like domain